MNPLIGRLADIVRALDRVIQALHRFNHNSPCPHDCPHAAKIREMMAALVELEKEKELPPK